MSFTASGDLDAPASKDQLKNLVEILKAYPTAAIKISSPGTVARAEAIRAALTAAGADAKRVTTEASTSPSAKISVRVTAK